MIGRVSDDGRGWSAAELPQVQQPGQRCLQVIQAVLRARFPERWQQRWEQIQRVYNLPDLARRPVLLDMIARTLPQLKSGETLNAARLYQVYTDLWLDPVRSCPTT